MPHDQASGRLMGWFDRLAGVFGQAPASVAPAPEYGLLQEGLFDGGGIYDPDALLSATQGGSPYFRRLTDSPRDLEPLLQAKMLSLAYWLFDANPLAKRAIELTRDYVVGEGIRAVAQSGPGADALADNDPARAGIQSVIDRFWEDPINRMDERIGRLALELPLTGEGIYPVTVNPVDGHVRIGTIDPALLRSVLVDPRNHEILTTLLIGSSDTTARPWKVVRVDEDPASPSYGRLVGVRPGELFHSEGRDAMPYEGACFFFRINAVSGARRGRSDLLPVADWIDAIDQLLAGEVDRALLMKSFVWDVTVQGATAAQIADYLKENGPPKPGSVRGHNEGVTWSAVSPDLRPYDAQVLQDLLIQHVANGTGLPKHWLGSTEGTNRATSAEMGDPSFKRLQARQREFRAFLWHIVCFVLDQAELAGVLPARQTRAGSRHPEPWPVTIDAPEMQASDVARMAGALREVGQGLFALVGEKVIDVEAAQQLTAVLFEHMGVALDVEALRARLKAAAEAEQTDPYTDASGAPPPPTLPTPVLRVAGPDEGAA